MYDLLLVVQSLRPHKGPGYLTMLVFLWSSYSLWSFQSFPKLFYKSPWALFNVSFGVSTSLSIGFWVDPLRGKLHLVLVCKHSRVPLIVSGIELPWDRSQVWPLIAWPFPQFLLYLYPYIASRQTNFGSKVLYMGYCPYPSTGGDPI